MSTPSHAAALAAALAGDWQQAHAIVQDMDDALACWIHAILHKIEGDEWNSRYWYRRAAGKRYEDVADARDELHLVLRQITPEATEDNV